VFILAYIDPGSGSLIIQALIAAVLSVPFFFRRAIASAVQRVGRRSGDRTTAGDAASTDLGD
jgi:hypothetical protein